MSLLQGILGSGTGTGTGTRTGTRSMRERRILITDKPSSRKGSLTSTLIIPIQYVIIGLAFFIALYVNAIEERQSTLQDFVWNDYLSIRSKDVITNDDDNSGSNDTASTIASEDSSLVNPNTDNTAESSPSSSSSGAAEASIIIGWVVTITGCGPNALTDGAAVLKHSIHLASIKGGNKYDYKMYAIYHPEGEACALSLKDLGYQLIRRETPVAVQDIKGKFLRKKIESNGCCGEKELIKLEAYTLIDHPVVVQLDLDVILLKPMDALFDLMLAKSPTSNLSTVPVMWRDQAPPKRVNAFFTRDYHLIAPEKPYKAVQGGFLVLRPDMAVYEEFLGIIKTGIQKPGGWGGLVGPFYGFMTIQGIIPYYYDVLHKKEAMELNRCIYNQMMDDPRDNTANDNPQAKCRTNQEECEDCRTRPLEDIVSAHFTFCPKPWTCFPNDSDTIDWRLCRQLHHEWFRIRSDLEQSWGRDPLGTGTFQQDHFFGFCGDYGQAGFMPIEQPFGLPIPSSSESNDGDDEEDSSGEVSENEEEAGDESEA